MRWKHCRFRFGDLKMFSASPLRVAGPYRERGNADYEDDIQSYAKNGSAGIWTFIGTAPAGKCASTSGEGPRISGSAGAGKRGQWCTHHAFHPTDAIAKILDGGSEGHLHPNPCGQNPESPYTSSSATHTSSGIELCRICLCKTAPGHATPHGSRAHPRLGSQSFPPGRPSGGQNAKVDGSRAQSFEGEKSNPTRRGSYLTLGATCAEVWAISGIPSLWGGHSAVGAVALGPTAGATSWLALSFAISRCSSVARSSRMRSCSVRRWTNDSKRAT